MTTFTFFALAVVCAVQAFRLGGFGWLLLWPALSFSLIAFAYFLNGVQVYGKRANGTIQTFTAIRLFPAKLLIEVMWWISRIVGRSRAFDEIVPGLFLGRRPTSIPDGVVNVVDLAGEFAANKSVRCVSGYRSCPILDFSIASDSQFVEIVKSILNDDGPTLVHCAQGRGRSAQVVAGILIARGFASSADEAITMIRSIRQHVRLGAVQRRQLERCVPAFVGFADHLTSPPQSHTKSCL